MKICYIVYREDNVMVFDSQVLEYLQKLKEHPEIEEISLVLFRHEKNMFKKVEIERKLLGYVDTCISFPTLPALTVTQLDVNSNRLRRYAQKKYVASDRVAVICRGDLAAYVGAKAFLNMKNCRVLYDNRGIAFEESIMAHGDVWIHKRNREIKLKALTYAKQHCDLYNFVTNPMRNYMIEKYEFSESIPYTIIPTLYKADAYAPDKLEEIRRTEQWQESDYVITYVGSTNAWQSTAQLVDIIEKASRLSDRVRFMVLTNGDIPALKPLKEKLKNRLTITSVKHSMMKYYLAISDMGIVIRDRNIVNRVAAPTKIAEYLTNGLKILYSGEIGIITDLKSLLEEDVLIEYRSNDNWLHAISSGSGSHKKEANPKIVAYFDMLTRQGETLKMLNKAFNKEREVIL